MLVNDACTQAFVVAEASPEELESKNGKAFFKLLQTVDAAMKLHGLPGYYDNPRPHVSLGWVMLSSDITAQQQLETAIDHVLAGVTMAADRCWVTVQVEQILVYVLNGLLFRRLSAYVCRLGSCTEISAGSGRCLPRTNKQRINLPQTYCPRRLRKSFAR